jgi:hypothetical protein
MKKNLLSVLSLIACVALSARAGNVDVTNPNSRPVPVNVISGGLVNSADPHLIAAPGSTPSPSPAKAVDVQGTGTANAALPILTLLKQYTGVPSNFTVGTTDATVFTLAAGEKGFIQNLDDVALYVKQGASASTSSFSYVLAAGTAADDGKGGAKIIDDWVGAVSVAAASGSPRYIAWKVAP